MGGFSFEIFIFVERQKTLHKLKCCNRPNHATAALDAVGEVATTEVDAPTVALTVLTALTTAPEVTGGKITKHTVINSLLENSTDLIVIIIWPFL